MDKINILLILITLVLILYYLNLCKYKKEVEYFNVDTFTNLR